MNLADLIAPSDKAVAAQNILNDKGTATLISIKKDAVLKAHQSTTKALLVLLSGSAIYEEAERLEGLSAYLDVVHIPARVTHKVTATEDAVLLLIQ